MKIFRKRSLSILLAFIITITMLPITGMTVSAASGVSDKIDSLLALFPNGSYFSKNGSACNHSAGSSCDNCKLSEILKRSDLSGLGYVAGTDYTNAWTCKAFTRFAFRYIFGEKFSSGNYYTVASGSFNQSLFSQAKKGDVIGFFSSSGSCLHKAVYIGGAGANSANFYQANFGGTPKVKYGSWTYANMASYYGSGSYGVIYRANNYDAVNSGSTTPPPHTCNKGAYMYFGKSHPHYSYYKCSICGEIWMDSNETNTYDSCEECNPAPTYEDIAPGKYFIKNKSNGNYLNVAYGEDEDLARLHLHPYGNYDAQVYDIYRVGEGYEMMPLISTTRVVNPYCWTVESGKIVNLYSKTNESSQWWRFQPVENGYVIRNVQNPKVCLASSDNITVETYTGANNQIWYLEEVCTIQYDANGGSETPAPQRVRAGYQANLSSQQPTKKCHIFTGWSLDKNGNVASWEEKSDITTYEDIILYAVWDSNHTYSSNTDSICNSCGFERALLFTSGDVNGNGEITAEDALLALQAATDKILLTDEEKTAADVDGAVGVTANDALLILQYATKKIAAFPVAG